MLSLTRADQAGEPMPFVDFWQELTGSDPPWLYIDSITPERNILNTNPKRKRGPPSLTLRVVEDLSCRRNSNSFALQTIGGPGETIDLRRAVERFVLRIYKGQTPRR